MLARVATSADMPRSASGASVTVLRRSSDVRPKDSKDNLWDNLWVEVEGDVGPGDAAEIVRPATSPSPSLPTTELSTESSPGPAASGLVVSALRGPQQRANMFRSMAT